MRLAYVVSNVWKRLACLPEIRLALTGINFIASSEAAEGQQVNLWLSNRVMYFTDEVESVMREEKVHSRAVSWGSSSARAKQT